MDLTILNSLRLISALIVLYLLCWLDCAAALPEYYVEDHCSQTLALNYGTIESVRLRLTKSLKYPDGMRCAMRIQAPQGKRLYVRFETFDVHGLQDLQCQSGDYAQFFDGALDNSVYLPGLPQRVCSPPDTKKFVTSGSYMVIRFMSDTDNISGRGITLLITAFSDGPCGEDQFKCVESGRCIQKALECDGEFACFDESDEAMPKCLSTAAIAGIAVGGGIVLVLIIVVIVLAIVKYEKRRRARIIKRAVDHGFSVDTFWYESSQSSIDPSRIDPIWDGGPSPHSLINPSCIDSIWDDGLSPQSQIDRSRIGSFWDDGLSDNKNNTNNEFNINDKHIDDDHTGDARKNSKQYVTVMGPGGKKMQKIPSSFWDISFSDLQLLATSSTQTADI